MATSSALHQNLPLEPSRKEIRLLTVEPGQWNEDVRTKLHVASLEDGIQYSALSYVWGQLDPDAGQRVWVNGHDVPVTPNLFLALRRLRAHADEEKLVIWIDALCIDQSSTEERNQQVGMMGDIYRGCAEVLIWFGGFEARYSSQISDCWSFAGDYRDYSGPLWLQYLDSFGVEDFNQEMPVDGDPDDHLSSPLEVPGICVEKDRIEKLQDLELADAVFHFAWFFRQCQPRGLDRLSDASWKMVPHNTFVPPEDVPADWRGYWSRTHELLSAVLDDPWYQRLWVVQELALPPRVRIFFGPVSMPLETFMEVLGRLPRVTVLKWDGGENYDDRELLTLATNRGLEMLLIRDSQTDPYSKKSLLETRLEMLHREASVDHDQVYSLLGIGNSFVRPDYGGSPGAAFAQVCVESVIREGRLFFLSFSAVKARYPDTPSWVVDWTAFQADAKRRAWLKLQKNYVETMETCFPERVNTQRSAAVVDGALHVDGEEVDAVAHILPDLILTRENGARSEDMSGEPVTVLRCLKSPTSPYPGGWLWGEVWLRTLCLDRDWGIWYDGLDSQVFEREGMEHLLVLSGYPNIEVKGSKEMHSGPAALRHIFCKERESPLPAATSMDPEYVATIRASWQRVRKHIERMMYGCRLFVTGKGYLGCGNQNVAVGDKVFLLPGAPVPILLRSLGRASSEPEEGFRVVSDMFTVGYMEDDHWLVSEERLKRIRIE